MLLLSWNFAIVEFLRVILVCYASAFRAFPFFTSMHFYYQLFRIEFWLNEYRIEINYSERKRKVKKFISVTFNFQRRTILMKMDKDILARKVFRTFKSLGMKWWDRSWKKSSWMDGAYYRNEKEKWLWCKKLIISNEHGQTNFPFFFFLRIQSYDEQRITIQFLIIHIINKQRISNIFYPINVYENITLNHLFGKH